MLPAKAKAVDSVADFIRSESIIKGFRGFPIYPYIITIKFLAHCPKIVRCS